MRAARLLDRRSACYRARIALTVGLFAVGWTVFAQVFRSGRHNDLLGLLCANLLIG